MERAMGTMAWDDQLETGHFWMDRDHKNMVVLITQLADAIENHEEKRVCDTVLDEMIWHLKEHFGAEEQLMAKHQYPKFQEHQAEHMKLLMDLIAYRGWFDSGASGLYPSLIDFLQDWWSIHILTSDRELATAIPFSIHMTV
jgi:hemerythrin-like metal-binding protein